MTEYFVPEYFRNSEFKKFPVQVSVSVMDHNLFPFWLCNPKSVHIELFLPNPTSYMPVGVFMPPPR